jgi:hypothetical protein
MLPDTGTMKSGNDNVNSNVDHVAQNEDCGTIHEAYDSIKNKMISATSDPSSTNQLD